MSDHTEPEADDLFPTEADARRRRGCLALAAAGGLLLAGGIVAAIAYAGDADGSDDQCDDLSIEIAYLEPIAAGSAELTIRLDDAEAAFTDAGCE